MFTAELYAKIRRAAMVDGVSHREAAMRFGIHRKTIAKMLQFSVPASYHIVSVFRRTILALTQSQ